MLSYQHAYHAGNLADVHKHAALAWTLDYMAQKPKPFTYMETHAGRGLYDLGAPEAHKTGEALGGIARALGWFDADHPYARVIAGVRAAHGPDAYPGSPLIAHALLRWDDPFHLAELHPAEAAALALACPVARLHRRDGLDVALSLAPPVPARGLCLIDPSWEVKDDYRAIPDTMAKLARKWPVGCIMLWYPILAEPQHAAMLRQLRRQHPEGLCHEVAFPPARPGHGMVGSGLFVVNPAWGLAAQTAKLGGYFAALAPQPDQRDRSPLYRAGFGPI